MAAIALATVPDVELARTGQWMASTGESTLTRDDLAAAVEAMACPSVRNPVIKLGHCDPRFDGEPAVGQIKNLEVVDGYSLRGDLDGLPGWLGDILASAYPSRSIEATWNYTCQLGHVHDFVLTGLALLGVQEPAIGTLTSIEDVEKLYTYQPDTIAAKGNPMGHNKFAASATVEDVRRAYYDAASWDLWIEEIQLDPFQLIVVDDVAGSRVRVPIIVDPAGDGPAAISFGDPVPVVVRYDDTAQPTAPVEGVSAPAVLAASRLRFASRADSRRDLPGGNSEGETMASKKIAAASGSGDATPDGLTEDQLAKLREVVGLTEDADPAVLASALEALVSKVKQADDNAPDDQGDEEKPADDSEPAADGTADNQDDDEKKKVAASGPRTVVVDAEQWDAVQQFMASARKKETAEQLKAADEMVEAAFAAGKIHRKSVAAYKAQARKDPAGTQAVLDTIAPSAAFSVGEVGHQAGVADTNSVTQSDAYKNWSI